MLYGTYAGKRGRRELDSLRVVILMFASLYVPRVCIIALASERESPSCLGGNQFPIGRDCLKRDPFVFYLSPSVTSSGRH